MGFSIKIINIKEKEYRLVDYNYNEWLRLDGEIVLITFDVENRFKRQLEKIDGQELKEDLKLLLNLPKVHERPPRTSKIAESNFCSRPQT